MKLVTPKGVEVDIPVGGTHASLEERLRLGWTLPPAAEEPGLAPVSFAPARIDGPPPLPPESQDDVAHGADAPNVSC